MFRPFSLAGAVIPLLMSTPPFSLLLQVRADAAPSNAPRTGELQISGRVLSGSVAAHQVTLKVFTFTLPSGRSRALGSGKRKQVLISGGTRIEPFGGALNPGVSVVVTGRGAGSGQPLVARVVQIQQQPTMDPASTLTVPPGRSVAGRPKSVSPRTESLVASSAVTIFDACYNGDLAAVKEILRSDPRKVNARLPDFRQPLHLAATIDIARFLIAKGADVNGVAGSYPHSGPAARSIDDSAYGYTPLFFARNAAITRLLLAHGANPKHVTRFGRDAVGRTPLFHAPDAESARLLLAAGVDPRATDWRGETALHWLKDPGAIRIVVEAGGDPNACTIAGFANGPWFQNLRGRSVPLMYAHSAATVRALLDNRANIESRDELGRTPLLACLDVGDTGKDRLPTPAMDARVVEVVALLLDRGANVNAVDQKNLGALHWAVTPGPAELILKRGADPNKRVLGGAGNLGYVTPLERMVQQALPEMVRLYLRYRGDVHGKALESVFQGDGRFRTSDRSGAEALRQREVETVQVLLQAGAGENKSALNSLLAMSALHCRADICGLALDAGAEINASAYMGHSVLGAARLNFYHVPLTQQQETCVLLQQHGARD